jgi:hypothetical protein
MVFLKLSKIPYICFGLQPDHHQGVTSYTFYTPSICSFSSTCNVGTTATEGTYGRVIKSVAGNHLMMVWLQTETYVGVFRQS